MYWGESNIYAATSLDLIHWTPVEAEDPRGYHAEPFLLPLLSIRKHHFDSDLIEPGPQAIIMEQGILLIYNSKNHGQHGDPNYTTGAYCAAQVLFDLKDPSVVIARSTKPFLMPDKEYEMNGQINHVCFVEGLVYHEGVWNEDSLIVNDTIQLYGVIDGATSLEPYRGLDGETGGYLAAQLIAKAIIALSQDKIGQKLSPQCMLMQANQQLRDEMIATGVDVTRKEQLWSACALLVRVNDTQVEFAHAGDCMLVAMYEDGTTRLVTRDQLEVVDRPTRQLWAEGVASGLTSREELWQFVKPQIHAGRALMNTVNGYSVLNGEPELADHMEYGRISRAQLTSLFLFSDGLIDPQREHSLDEDLKQIVFRVKSMGLENYIHWLIQIEEADPDCLQFPRVKKSDDKTAIYLEL